MPSLGLSYHGHFKLHVSVTVTAVSYVGLGGLVAHLFTSSTVSSSNGSRTLCAPLQAKNSSSIISKLRFNGATAIRTHICQTLVAEILKTNLYCSVLGTLDGEIWVYMCEVVF